MKLILLIFIISNLAMGSQGESKQKRWNKLMNLVNQEMKILESAKRKGVEIKYRMLELHSEKLKLIHEKNNSDFMEKSKLTCSGRDKEKYFTETRSYYFITRDFGLKILKEEIKNSRIAEIKFAMALNSRDYGQDNITERFLLDAISHVKDTRNSLKHHAETALADFYYNEKRFPEAILYYQRVIKNTEDDWMTKHLFNLSWCYLKNRNFNAAIETIKKSYFESKNPLYVNIKDQVLENIGSFYVYAGRPLEGLEFYLKNEKDPISYLMPMALKASDKGHEKETKEILDAAQKVIVQNEFYQYQEELLHTYLDFYRHYNKFSDHERMSKDLVAYYKKAELEIQNNKNTKFKVELKNDAIEKMRSLAGFLQVKLAKDVKKDATEFSRNELNIVLSFFGHLIALDPTRKVEYFYFRAETYYSVLEHQLAAQSYVEAVTEAKKVKNDDLARKSLNSLLALTGQEILEKSLNRKYLIFSYSEYLALWPRDPMSEKIYPKLFDIYREDLDDQRATSVIASFNQSYPEHLKDQQVLMTKILDQFIEKKNTDRLTHWIAEFKKGFLAFSKDTIEKTEIVLGNILFLQYQELAKKGDRLAAAKGFESLYVHKLYPDKVKYQAALFSAMAYLELGETEQSFKWQFLAWKHMTEDEKLQRRDEMLKMSERSYKLQDFVSSFKSSEFLLKKFCPLKDDTQNRFFEIAIMTSLVEEKPLDSIRIVNTYSKCLKKIETKDSSLAQIYQHFEKRSDFSGLQAFVKMNSNEPYATQYRNSLQKWYWEKSDPRLKSMIRKELRDLNHPETLTWLKEIQLLSLFENDFKDFLRTDVWNKSKFDGDQFNTALDQYLLRLKKIKDDYHSLTQSSQLDLSIFATKNFAEIYLHVGKTIQNLKPLGMNPVMVKDFQSAMKGLSTQFISASKEYEKNLRKVSSSKTSLLWGARSIASVEKVENPISSSFSGVTMDKFKE